MRGSRRVIINADDFGLSPGVNDGIIESHERGIVTSASLMVRWPAAIAAAEYAREHPQLDVGLHLDFGEWVCRDGKWVWLYEVVPCQEAGVIAEEGARQLKLFRQLLGREPTHIDSHQHAHSSEPARSVVIAVAAELGVPLRHYTPGIEYCGGFYGQNERGEPFPELVGAAALIDLLKQLPPGTTELSCHPARGQDLPGMYVQERELERRTLCDPLVRLALVELEIELCSFLGIAHDSAPTGGQPLQIAL